VSSCLRGKKRATSRGRQISALETLRVRLEEAIRPIEPVLELLDRRLRHPVELNRIEFSDLVSFVRDALLDERARKENLCTLVPPAVPSGLPVLQFEACPERRALPFQSFPPLPPTSGLEHRVQLGHHEQRHWR